MDMWMDVDTALAEVPVNLMPLIDDTDFKTRETAIAYNASGMDLVWNFVTTGGAYTQTAVTPTTAGTYDWTHQGDGMYSIEIPASGGASINNDTEGFGWFSGVVTGVLPFRGPVIGFRAAALNDALIDSAWSTTRGLAGTALPNAAADAAGGLIISDAGGLDADAILSRMGTPSNLGGGATLAANLSDIESQTDDIGAAGAGLTSIPNSAGVTTLLARIGAFTGSGVNTILGFFQALFRSDASTPSDIGGTFDPATESNQAIRDRGDAAWVTGGGGSISDLINVVPLIPPSIDLADTATWRIGVALTNALDDLPSTAEITPGTITIDRKAIGGTTWTNIVSAAACSEAAGIVYYDQAFNSGAGFAEGDSIRITLAGQIVTVSANDYEITGSGGRIFYTEVRQTMRGTNGAYTGTPPTASDIASQVRTELTTELGRVDAAISTRATPAQVNTEADQALADVGLTTTITGRIDAAISSRLASASYTAPLDADGIRTALGLSSANLDTQLATIAGYIDTEVAGLVTDLGTVLSRLTATRAGYLDNLSGGAVATQASVNTIDDFLDTEIAAIIAAIAALNNVSSSDVLNQVNTALNTAIAELGVGTPSATPTLRTAVMLLYMTLRNRTTTTASAQTIQNDAGTTIATAALADDGTTMSKAEFA